MGFKALACSLLKVRQMDLKSKSWEIAFIWIKFHKSFIDPFKLKFVYY